MTNSVSVHSHSTGVNQRPHNHMRGRQKLTRKRLQTTYILGLALLASLAIASCSGAKDVAQQPAVAPISAASSSQSLASKLMPAQTRSRTSRSLSDMFEKVKSKIFGSKKQANAAASATSSQIAPAASVNVAQRQPWGELSTQQLNSLNQQYSPYSAINGYQWPSASGNQMFNQQYSPMGSYSPMSAVQSSSSNSMMSSGMDASQPGSLNPAANSNGQSSNGGLLSSASQIIAQYLSPSSGSSSANQAAGANQAASNSNPQQGSSIQGQNNMMNPQQQQQQQTSYNEFASILDSMVAQTGVGSQRQPSLSNYLGQAQTVQQSGQAQVGIQSGQQQQQQPNYGQMGSPAMVGDNDMSGSSSIQSYMPASSQQASQKSSMVSLAEQLAPGAQFNKLVSFPFSLSNNEDPAKEGRYKLHIPFLNQHVKRSDQPAPSASQQQQQQQQQQQRPQYLNSYYNQQYSNQAQQQQQPLAAQASQVIPTVVSPQSPASAVQSSPASSSAAAVAPSSVAQSSPSGIQSAVASQSSSMSQSSASNSPSVVSSVSSQSQSNGRPSWSIADSQANSVASSKLIPMQSSSSADSVAASQN